MMTGCDVDRATAEEPVEVAAQPSVSTPTPEPTGVTPASGWGASYESSLGYQRRNDGTVLFHGGTWTVPFTARPGETISGAVFTIEAPTGHSGDPSTVAVELFSSQAVPSLLGQTQLTPFGIGARVNGNIPLSTPRVVAPGETFQLVFVPLSGGDYATSDTTIDGVGILHPRRTRTDKISALGGVSIGGAFQLANGQLTGNWSPINDGDLLGVNVPVHAGDRLDSVSVSVFGNTGYTIAFSAFAQDDAFHVAARIGSEQTSLAQNSTQTLTVVPLDSSGNPEQVTATQRSYSLQFRAHRAGPTGGGQLYVGPITLATSSSN